jgi:AbrB family looped-hinge helix DNA binding protein
MQGMMLMGYVSKLTSAGQLTIPKEIRQRLRLRASSLVVLDEVGDVVLLRPLEADEETLRILRRKLKKTGLTRMRVNEIVERERAKLWKETTESIR